MYPLDGDTPRDRDHNPLDRDHQPLDRDPEIDTLPWTETPSQEEHGTRQEATYYTPGYWHLVAASHWNAFLFEIVFANLGVIYSLFVMVNPKFFYFKDTDERILKLLLFLALIHTYRQIHSNGIFHA